MPEQLKFPKTRFSNPAGDLNRAIEMLDPVRQYVSDSAQNQIFYYRYIPVAPGYATGPHLPILYAKALIPNLNWVQIVRITKDPEVVEGIGLQVWSSNEAWELVDSTPRMRQAGKPFYSEHYTEEFLDNPCYWGTDPYLYRRVWQAYLFAVSVKDSDITFRTGISWGFKTLPSGSIVPLEITTLTRESWTEHVGRISSLFPKWSFL